MNDTPKAIVKEAADLHRFLQPLAKMCAVARSDHPYYCDASYKFLVYISDLLRSTLKYLESLPGRISEKPVIQRSTRQKLKLLRGTWGLLHRYVKPCLEADALHTPIPLLNLLSDRVRGIRGCADFEYAVYHLTNVNYATATSEEVDSVANNIATKVNGEPFPPTIRLVGFPYSQFSSLFLNCSIAHEMAHFVHEQLFRKSIAIQIDQILASRYPEASEDPSTEQDENARNELEKRLETLSEIRGLLNTWVEEVFCDLFAISLVGPAFTFAYSELHSGSLISESMPNRPDPAFEFSPWHPADVARLYLHKRFLDKLGWWEFIGTWNLAPISLLDQCCDTYKRTTLSSKISGDARTTLDLECFWSACDWLIDLLKTQLPDPKREIAEMDDQYSVISSYLAKAIVPSTIVTNGVIVHPSPIVLINAAYRFVLEEIDRLLENIEGLSDEAVKKRSWYTERLELWVLKSLEDLRFIRLSQEGV